MMVLQQVPAYASGDGWFGKGSFAVVRNYPTPTAGFFHDRLSVTIGVQRTVVRKISVGPEIGYHGFWSADAVQCGPEWDADCPVSNPYRAGVWEGAAIAQVEMRETGVRPYALVGGGPYLAGNFVVENRQAEIKNQLQLGVTAGAGFRCGPIGMEARWHYIPNGLATWSYDTSIAEGIPVFSYSPLRLYCASLCIYIN